MARFFLIMGHKTPEDAHAHVEEKHGVIVESRLLPSPAREMVYGVIEFVPPKEPDGPEVYVNEED